MRTILLGAVAVAMAALAWGATPARKAPATKRKAPARTSTASSKKATPKGTSSKSGGTARQASAKKSGSKKPTLPRTTWRNRQSAPSLERYREIQDALVAKGYLDRDAAAGTWGESSTTALKRFQADQNIESTGKINSLSLIALGLGPKRDYVPVPPPTPVQEVPNGR